MEEKFRSWRATVPASYQAQIDALAKDDTVLIHILRGHVLSNSRGAMSSRSYDPRVKSQCLFHPVADQVKPSRDWDVVLDFNRLMLMEKELGLPMPVEALLQHEIFGHVVPAMAGALDSEDNAIREENEYRKAVGLPLVPWSFGRK